MGDQIELSLDDIGVGAEGGDALIQMQQIIPRLRYGAHHRCDDDLRRLQVMASQQRGKMIRIARCEHDGIANFTPLPVASHHQMHGTGNEVGQAPQIASKASLILTRSMNLEHSTRMHVESGSNQFLLNGRTLFSGCLDHQDEWIDHARGIRRELYRQPRGDGAILSCTIGQ